MAITSPGRFRRIQNNDCVSLRRILNNGCVNTAGWVERSETHLRRRQSAKNCDEAVDILFIVIDVRADAHAPDARSDIDVFRRELLDQAFRYAGRKVQAQNM